MLSLPSARRAVERVTCITAVLALQLATAVPLRAEIRLLFQEVPALPPQVHPAAADSGGGGGVDPNFSQRQAQARCRALLDKYTKQIARFEDREGFAMYGQCADLGWIEAWNPLRSTGYYVYSYPYYYVFEVLKGACDPSQRGKYAVKSMTIRDYDVPKVLGVGNCYDYGLVTSPPHHGWFKRYQRRNIPDAAFWVYAYPDWHVWQRNMEIENRQPQTRDGNAPLTVPTWEPGHKPQSGFWDALPEDWSQ